MGSDDDETHHDDDPKHGICSDQTSLHAHDELLQKIIWFLAAQKKQLVNWTEEGSLVAADSPFLICVYISRERSKQVTSMIYVLLFVYILASCGVETDAC